MTGAELRALRLNRGLTLEKAAADIGVTRPVLTRAEAGRVPHPANALRIASFYGHQVTEIWPLSTEAEAPAT